MTDERRLGHALKGAFLKTGYSLSLDVPSGGAFSEALRKAQIQERDRLNAVIRLYRETVSPPAR